MIYNRYSPCHVVYVLYNCSISFVISNPHTHHYTLISLQALLSLQEDVPPFVGEYIPRIYYIYILCVYLSYQERNIARMQYS